MYPPVKPVPLSLTLETFGLGNKALQINTKVTCVIYGALPCDKTVKQPFNMGGRIMCTIVLGLYSWFKIIVQY